MIVISSSLVLSSSVSDELNINSPVIGYHNLVTISNLLATTALANYPVTNLANPSTAELWRAGRADLVQYVSVDVGAGEASDYLGIARHNFGTLSTTLSVEGWDGTTLDTGQKVLVHFDGDDGAVVISDVNVGGSAHTWTVNGDAQIDTSTYKFGGSSMLFDGTGDYVTTPDSADFTLGSGDFTVDFWFKCNAASGVQAILAGQMDSSATVSTISFYIERSTGDVINAIISDGASGVAVTGTTQFTPSLNTGWHHVALMRSGNVLKLFIDGVQEGGNVAFTGSVADSSNALSVGRGGEVTSATWNGWIDEFRLTVGEAKWTANFAPPDSADDGKVRTQLVQEGVYGDDRPIIFRYESGEYQQIRLKIEQPIEGTPELGVIYVGRVLQLQRRIYVGHTPITYGRDDRVVTGVSQGGNYLGRIIQEQSKMSAVTLSNMTPSWYRTYLDPFIKISKDTPFFWAWRPGTYPLEVGYSWITSSPRPSNQRSNGMMQIDWTLGAEA
jgi:Concanavalin A-like lectin/glucanases superfamily